MNKLWLCGITQNREKDIDELTSLSHKIFDGLVFVVNQPSTDNTFDILEERKGEGKIIKRPFVPHHAFLMNEFLFSGVIKNLDWFMIVDSSDRINPVWLKRLRDDIEHWSKNNINAIYLDRIYLARYFDPMEFFGGVHWGLGPIFGRTLNLTTIPGYRKENFIINTRNNNPVVSAIEHPIKYYVQYPNDSQVELLYRQFGDEVFNRHRINRLNFRIYIQALGLDCTIENVKSFIEDGIKNKTLPRQLIDFIESEVNLCDLVRHYILKQSLQELADNRFNWSFKKFYHEGLEHQGKNDGYIGLFNQYRLQKGLEME